MTLLRMHEYIYEAAVFLKNTWNINIFCRLGNLGNFNVRDEYDAPVITNTMEDKTCYVICIKNWNKISKEMRKLSLNKFKTILQFILINKVY